MSSQVIIGSDHAGFSIKALLVTELSRSGYTVQDVGATADESCDYPVFAQKVCERVLATGNYGILICGTGIGMSMAANRTSGIRAALCTTEFHARAARRHNNANILCLGERVTGPGIVLDIVAAFLETAFQAGRHQRRVALFDHPAP